MSIPRRIEARKAAKQAHEQGICPLCKKPVKPYINFCGQCGCDLRKGVKLATPAPRVRVARTQGAARCGGSAF